MVNSAHKNSVSFYTLLQTAEILKVKAETLIEWNENNILKPTITQNGTVVYKKEQIDKFLAAQKTLKEIKSTQDISVDFPQSPPLNLKSETSTKQPFFIIEKFSNQPKKVFSPKISSRTAKTFAIISIIILITFAVTFSIKEKAAFQSQIDSELFSEKEIAEVSIPIAQMEKVYLPDSENVSETETAASNNRHKLEPSEILKTSENKLAALQEIFQYETATHEAEKINQLPILISLNSDGTNQVEPINQKGLQSFASRSNHSDSNTPSDILAVNLGFKDLIQNNSISKKQSFSGTFIFVLIFASLIIPFLLNKQYRYSTQKMNLTPVPLVNPGTQRVHKMIEVNQKTDGTVVSYFQGKEYKVSKPELGSESDQFIERLLAFAPNEVKEINYNIFEDKSLSLNAPLSKIVTRLGFVGLKRDLFFPRTSKNSVLFRRYLTQDDLNSMNLTSKQIETEFKN